MEAKEDSRERERRMKKAAYDYCKRKGICVICQKEPAFYNKVRCPSCMEKQTLRQAKRSANMTQANRDDKNRKKRERYHRLKEAGLCVNCGRKAQEGKTTCVKCNMQQRRCGESYRIRSGKKKGWDERGLCIRCGGERVEGKKICDSCLERNRELMANARKSAPKDRTWERC